MNPIERQKALCRPPRPPTPTSRSAWQVHRAATTRTTRSTRCRLVDRLRPVAKDLEKITAPVMFVNSADDFINPPELGIAEREIKRVKRGQFVLIPITDETRGHGTHTQAAVWKQYLAQLLAESQ